MGNDQDNSERLVRLETKFDFLETILHRIENKLDAREDSYVSREALNEVLKSRDDKLNGIQKQINEIKEDKKEIRRSYPDWINSAILVGTVIVGIALYVAK